MASPPTRPQSFLRLRGKSFMSVVLTPEPPLDGWVSQLDGQVARSPKVFEGRPVLLDVSLLHDSGAEIPALVQALEQRGIRVIGLDGSMPIDLDRTDRSLPPIMAGGRNATLTGENEPGYAASQRAPVAAPAAAPEAVRAAEPSALVLDQPVRSGQSVAHVAGDVTVVGSVASGSEVIAGGSIHVYGALRGRAIAGLAGAAPGGSRPRIFCSKLAAELLAIDGVYKTADEIDPALQGRAVQVWLDGEELRVAALD